MPVIDIRRLTGPFLMTPVLSIIRVPRLPSMIVLYPVRVHVPELSFLGNLEGFNI
jgi:hypothetical protein